MDRKYNLKLDLQFKCNNSTMKFNQFDNNTSDFFMRITNAGKLVDIEKAIVILAAIKPSGKVSSQFVEVENGLVYADLKNSMKDEIGTYTAQAMLILEDERVVTDPINYEVEEDKIFSLLNDTVEATEDFTLLTDMLNRLSAIEISEEQRQINEAERILSEENRKIEEGKRVEAELIRQHEEADRAKYDATRESNENIRKQNESIRLSNETNRIDEESKRVEEENKRKLAEEERNANYNFMTEDEERRRSEANAHKEAEVLRVQAETDRVNEEAKRRTTEQARVSAENTRVSNENTRKANEVVRQNNETQRVEAETQRQNRYNSFVSDAEKVANDFETYTNSAKASEEERKASELDRKSQEVQRVSNEVERISNENTRKASENARMESEKQRVDAENLRKEKIIEIQTDYDSLKKVIIDENASANLQNQINQTNSQLEHKANKSELMKVDNIVNRMKVNAFLTILESTTHNTNKTNEQIMKNINDLVDSCVDGFAIIVEIMPSVIQKQQYEAGTITDSDLIWECYPSIDIINNYLNICKEKGLNFREIKFHSLWAKQKSTTLDLEMFLQKYSNAVLSVLDSIVNKPIHATVMNEASNLVNLSTIQYIKQLLINIKMKGCQTGLTGMNVDEQLIDVVDNFYLHFYPSISTKKEKTTFCDAENGFISSMVWERVCEKMTMDYPNKNIIIDEVGCSNYWEALASPELYIGDKGFTATSNGMPMAVYAHGAIEYFKKHNVSEIYIFWTDSIPSELQKVIKRYKGVI